MLWLLRFIGLPLAATLACAAAPASHADPRSANACGRATFRVIIDVGHTEQAPGARSARGVPEFVFNLTLAKQIEQQLIAAGFRRSVLLITEGPARKGLVERVKRANALGAELFLSVHHDSVPDQFLEKWEFEGEERSFSDRFNGHSILSPMTTATAPAVCCLPRCLAVSCESADCNTPPTTKIRSWAIANGC